MKEQSAATYAAIDIGSNGARLLIKRFTPRENEPAEVEKLMFVRVPLRLGQDVFTLGKISEQRYRMMFHMLKGYIQFMKLYGVDRYRACATSAMRDAENGKKVMKRLEEKTGVKLEIIKGEEEAGLLFDNLVEKTDSNEGCFAYIDVGGGSTEYATRFGKVTIIGSGGNINKLCKLSNTKKSNELAVADLQKIYDQLKPMSVEQRMETYGMRTDRADVIVPAAEIFLHCAEYLECDTIKVPNISLADSIVDGLYKEMSK